MSLENEEINLKKDLEERGASKKRLNWIDQARGFIIFLMVFAMFLPKIWRTANVVTHFFLEHPPKDAYYMNLYDVGTLAFIFILGLLIGASYKRKEKTSGRSGAIKHIVVRYGSILLLGYLILLIDGGSFHKVSDEGLIILRWDVIPSLGLVGLLCLPVLIPGFSPKMRLLIAYLMLFVYHILLAYTILETYALESVHGGIFGTIFGYGAVMIIASSLGDELFSEAKKDRAPMEKYRNFILLGVINLIVGLVLAFGFLFGDHPLLNVLYANKRVVTIPYVLISIAVSILGSLPFIYIDEVKEKRILVLESYGKNPFLIYVMAVIIEFLLDELGVLDELAGQIVVLIIMMILFTGLLYILEKKGIIIKTGKVAVGTVILVVLLALILIPTGIISL